jgi:hypothetical protein
MKTESSPEDQDLYVVLLSKKLMKDNLIKKELASEHKMLFL